MEYLKLFSSHTDYEDYASGGTMVRPNVSYCEDVKDVHYNPYVPPSRVLTATFHITDTTNPTSLTYKDGWYDVESVLVTKPNGDTFELTYNDLVQYDSMAGIDPYMAYQFGTVGDYVFEYTLKQGVVSLSYDFLTNIPYVISVDVPNCITNIDLGTFNGCRGLTSITIPNSVTSIGYEAFSYCSSLTSITIPNSVTSIGYEAFSYCSGLTSVTIGNSVTSIGDYALRNCNGLTTIISLATTAPTITSGVFFYIKRNGTLYVPSGSNGYDTWMQNANYYLGSYNWTKVEQ